MKHITIWQNDAEQRLDKFLKKLLCNASISYIYKLNRKGNIKVNKKKKGNDYKLCLNDELKIFINDEEYKELCKKSIKKTSTKAFDTRSIIFEDSHLLVINKAAGVIVHPGDFKSTDPSLIEQVHDYLTSQWWGYTFQPSLVHRIDKETSGIILIAKQKQLLTQLVADFKTHNNIEKKYRVLVFWKMSRQNGTIKKKLLRVENAKWENKVQVSEKGLEAVTHYKLLHEYWFTTPQKKVIISELEIVIETGRMHQIRVHLASLGTPVIADKKYGDSWLNSYVKRHYSIDRQLLHASNIKVYNSIEKKDMSFTAPLKKDMKDFTKKLEKTL